MSDSTASVSDPTELGSYAINSYRYLRIAIVAVLLALLCSVALGALSVPAVLRASRADAIARAGAGATASPTTFVSIEFDDGTVDQYQARALLSSRAMHATFFVNSGAVGSAPYMTWSQLHDLASDGNEIGGHTISHADLPTLSLDEATRQVCNDRVNLTAAGFEVRSFAYPYGHTNASVEGIVRDCGYNSGRGVSGIVSPGACDGCPYAESLPPPDAYLTRTPENAEDTGSADQRDTTAGNHRAIGLSELEGFVTQAEEHGGGWVQLVFHHLCDASAGCGTYTISKSDFASLLSWLGTRAGRGTVVRTVSEMIGGRVQLPSNGPIAPDVLGVQNPSLETTGDQGAPTCWMYGSAGANTATWAPTRDAHTGTVAETVTISRYASGDRKLVQKQDLDECAPSIRGGIVYQLSEWYKGTGKIAFTIFTRDRNGAWVFCQESPAVPSSTTWTQATYRWSQPSSSPSCGTKNGYSPTAISFGLALSSTGSLTVDDASMVGVAATNENSTTLPIIVGILATVVVIVAIAIVASTRRRRRSRVGASTVAPPSPAQADTVSANADQEDGAG